jgi:SAM-dependent methyltransferase
MPVRRLIERVPVAGPVARRTLIRSQALWWQKARAPLRLRRVKLLNSLRGFRNAHTKTASNVARSNSRRAYERIFGDGKLLAEYLTPERLEFYDEVVNACFQFEPKRVIDVGCGGGHLLERLRERIQLDQVVGVDLASSAIAHARQLLPEGVFLVGDLYECPSRDAFDIVLCTEVLEHVQRPAEAARALIRLCNRGGIVLITVPDGEQDNWRGHLNFWSEGELHAFLHQFGEVSVERIDHGRGLLAILIPAR